MAAEVNAQGGMIVLDVSGSGGSQTYDTGCSRDSAGVIDCGTGVQGDQSGSLKLTSYNALGTYKVNGNLHVSATAPTISSGFGTSPSIASNNGTAAFIINVGTGGTASSGVIGFPTATNGWVVHCDDLTNPTTGGGIAVKQTGSTTTTATITGYNATPVATAWTASDILHCMAFGR